MHALTTVEFLTRLGTGVACGALIGVERQWRARMAGLRTNALVATGATLFVLYSEAVGDMGSPTRVASYVVSGIGFLGGGVILRDGAGVRGLNTAATLWCSAAVGVLAASGKLSLAVLGTVVVLAVHLVLRPAGRLLDRAPASGTDPDATVRATVHLVCERSAEPHLRALLLQTLTASGLAPTGLRARREGETAGLRAAVMINGDVAAALEQVISRLSLEPGVSDLHWHVDDEESERERPRVLA
ncbi:putative Mg2+ transporter-C (MgtC) family protein [Streptomyces puniciscabiei]|uniref:Putative Mg2+ transporter-C (MgtC) family protein n=1 Tax=Streptomyces puniciscabiei TaxID=164348 RepID=A0A542U834_9ACTN|nr:MgtC/SapB family protein [Streptomyces puniciscabiei]TQK95244.1 putative Mg2+ transporter-C (MgtC) family protein [Streptomyces puniciscabiei]